MDVAGDGSNALEQWPLAQSRDLVQPLAPSARSGAQLEPAQWYPAAQRASSPSQLPVVHEEVARSHRPPGASWAQSASDVQQTRPLGQHTYTGRGDWMAPHCSDGAQAASRHAFPSPQHAPTPAEVAQPVAVAR